VRRYTSAVYAVVVSVRPSVCSNDYMDLPVVLRAQASIIKAKAKSISQGQGWGHTCAKPRPRPCYQSQDEGRQCNRRFG